MSAIGEQPLSDENEQPPDDEHELLPDDDVVRKVARVSEPVLSATSARLFHRRSGRCSGR